MKKQFFCISALLVSVFGNAQVRVGIAGGYHAASASPAFFTATNVLNNTSSSLNSGHIGVTADVPAGIKNLFFQTGLSYFSRGQKQSFTLDTLQTNTFQVNATQKLNYLDIPFLGVYKFPLTKKFRFIIGGGPQLSVFLSGSETVTTIDKAKKYKEEKQEDLLVGKGEDRYKTSFISIAGIAGFEFGRIALTANYAKGLTDYYDRKNVNLRHESIGGTLGIYFFRSKPDIEAGTTKVKDTDGDGINDIDDECIDLAGSAITKGCPDRDGDGIADKIDNCPDKAGLVKYNGCPIPDTDGDGVNDEKDACPQVAGTVANNGCPEIQKQSEPDVKKPQVKEVITQKAVDQINLNAKRIAFKFRQAELTDESYKVLDEIVSLLKDSDVKIKVAGHSSLEGNPKTNLKLSQERADNVRKYLIKQGIAEERITSIGYGSTQPLVKGTSEKANVQNRRVEITIDK